MFNLRQKNADRFWQHCAAERVRGRVGQSLRLRSGTLSGDLQVHQPPAAMTHV